MVILYSALYIINYDVYSVDINFNPLVIYLSRDNLKEEHQWSGNVSSVGYILRIEVTRKSTAVTPISDYKIIGSCKLNSS